MQYLWGLTILNWLLVLMLLLKISQILDFARGMSEGQSIEVGPTPGTEIYDLISNCAFRKPDSSLVIVALSASCSACDKTMSDLLKNRNSLKHPVAIMDAYPDGNKKVEDFCQRSSLTFISGQTSTALKERLEVRSTPSFYVIDERGSFVEGSWCTGRSWSALFNATEKMSAA